MKRDLLIRIFVLFLSLQAVLGAQEGGDRPLEDELPDETTILIEDTENPAEEAAPGGAAISAWDIIRMILILAGVLILIYGIFRLMKRAGGAGYQDNGLITLHAGLGLGGSKSIHLIESGREFYLIGAGDNGVNLISKIDDKEAVDDLRFKISTASGPAENRNFSDIFSKLINRGKSEVSLKKSMSKSRDFMKEQRERLKKM